MPKTREELEQDLEQLRSDELKLRCKIHKLWGQIRKMKAHEAFGTDLKLTPQALMEAPYFEVEDIICSKLEKWFNDNYKYVSRGSGYFISTNQITLRIKVGKHDNIQAIAKEWEEWIPFIKEIDGAKRISIFEHTLSEFASYELRVKNNKYIIAELRLDRRGTDIATFKTLEEALSYIQEHHYYND
jgi:hypothetical protein